MSNAQGIEILKNRRSVRTYKDEVVSKEVMHNIMEATRFAPSWANYQIARYTFITNPEKIAKLITDGVNDFTYNINTLKNAKNVAILSFVKGKSGKLDPEKNEFATSKAGVWEVFDAGIACQTFCLAAHAYGVGTCIMGVINDVELANIAGLPEEETVAALIVYGYPEGDTPATPRKAVEEISRFID